MSILDLFVSIENADLKSVQNLLRADSSLVNGFDEDNYKSIKPIHLAVAGAAASYDASLIVHELISAGADVDSIGENGETPLHIAARQDQIAEMVQLVEAGAKINLRDWFYRTPFETIARSKNYACIGYLLSRGAGNDIRESVAFNRRDWAEWILRDDPNVVRQTPKSVDLIIYAIGNSNIELVKILIGSGAEVNSSPGSTTPLSNAIGWPEMVQLLLNSGADPNGCRPDVLLPDWRYPAWESPLAIAKRRGLSDSEALLKAYGATE